MKIRIAQINPKVGDIKGNCQTIIRCIHESHQSDLLVFPELCICGYPPKDLLLKSGFLSEIKDAETQIKAASQAKPELGIIIGTVHNQQNLARFIQKREDFGPRRQNIAP
jgi:Predicted amidohydrolase